MTDRKKMGENKKKKMRKKENAKKTKLFYIRIFHFGEVNHVLCSNLNCRRKSVRIFHVEHARKYRNEILYATFCVYVQDLDFMGGKK